MKWLLNDGPLWSGRGSIRRPKSTAGPVYGPVPFRTLTPKTTRIIKSGHSLEDINFAFSGDSFGGLFLVLAKSRGVVDEWNRIRKSTIPGSHTRFRWEMAEDSPLPGDNARYDIADYGLLTIAEGGPIAGPYSDNVYEEGLLQEDMEYLKRFVANTRENGNGGAGADVLFYTIWPSIDGSMGPFRETLGGKYERAFHYRQETVNRDLGGYLYMIPGHRIMMRLYDDIQAGMVPGITDIQQLFVDDIHPNGWGSYPIACLNMAIIYGEDPRGLPYEFVTRSDNPPRPIAASERMTSALATYMQDIAYEVAQTYARAGLGGTDMGVPGRLPDLTLMTPREVVGNRLVFAIDYTDGPQGPVSQVVGDGVTINAVPGYEPTRVGDSLEFAGDAIMHGSVNVSGERYMLRFMRVNRQNEQYLDPSFVFNVNDVTWQGPNHSIMENSATTFTNSNPDIGSQSLNRELEEFWMIERFWGLHETWSRIENRLAAKSEAREATGFPATTKIQVGGALDGGSFASPTFFHADVNLVADVVVNSMPTEEERRQLVFWARSLLQDVPAKAAVRTTVPEQVAGLTHTVTEVDVNLTWNTPVDGGSAITDYVIRMDGNVVPHTEQTATTFTVLNVPTGAHAFTVAAVNSVGEGPQSASRNVTMTTPTLNQLARYDVNFADASYKGGVQPDTYSPLASDNRFFKVSATSSQTMYALNKDGTLSTRSTSQTILRRTDRGAWVESSSGNPVLYTRDLTQAPWVKTGCRAIKDRSGRVVPVVANSSCRVVVDAAGATLMQALTYAAGVSNLQFDMRRLVGTGTVEVTLDSGVTWTSVNPTTNMRPFFIPLQNLPANPTIGFRFGTAGNEFEIDMVFATRQPYRHSPLIQTNNTRTIYYDRYTTGIAGGSNGAYSSGLLEYLRDNINWGVYVEWNTIKSNAQQYLFGPVTQIGADGSIRVQTAVGNDLNSPPELARVSQTNWMERNNRSITWSDGGTTYLCVNGGEIMSQAGSSLGPYTELDHKDLGGNGNGGLNLDGVIARIAFVGSDRVNRIAEIARQITVPVDYVPPAP